MRPDGVPAAAPISYTHEPAQDAMLDKFAAAGFKYDGNGGWQADLSTTELLALGAALGVALGGEPKVEGWLNMDGERILTAKQKHSMENHQGAAGKSAAKEYTIALVRAAGVEGTQGGDRG